MKYLLLILILCLGSIAVDAQDDAPALSIEELDKALTGPKKHVLGIDVRTVGVFRSNKTSNQVNYSVGINYARAFGLLLDKQWQVGAGIVNIQDGLGSRTRNGFYIMVGFGKMADLDFGGFSYGIDMHFFKAPDKIFMDCPLHPKYAMALC